jgi:signal transduction histidine kinase
MRQLYLRIYLAVLASLVVFAVAAAIVWRLLGDGSGAGFDAAAVLAGNVLPPADAPAAEQQAALERLAANLRADVALFAPDRRPLAAVGQPLPSPDPDRERGGWLRAWGPPAGAVHLRDGRWLVARMHAPHRPHGAPFLITLGLLALAVGIAAYPIARRLTARLERLQTGVESLGAGNLAARVRVEGRDEVARLAESFNRAAGRIEALVGAHKTLLAHASHELRTPLTRIRMAVELLGPGTDADRRRDLARDIAELDALIDDLLLASRLDAEREADEDVDLLALASEECARYEDVAVEGQPGRRARRSPAASPPDPQPRGQCPAPRRAPGRGARPRRGRPCRADGAGPRARHSGRRARGRVPSLPAPRGRHRRRHGTGADPGAPDRAPARRRGAVSRPRGVPDGVRRDPAGSRPGASAPTPSSSS